MNRLQHIAAFAVLCGIAFLIRWSYIHTVPDAIYSDMRDHDMLAMNLANGQGYVIVYSGEMTPLNGETLRAHRAPGYPVFLAVIYRGFGLENRHRHVYIVQAVLGALTVGLTYWLGCQWFSTPVGIVAAICLLPFYFFDALLLSETLYTAVLTLLIGFLSFLRNNLFRPLRYVVVLNLGYGILLGLGALIKPITMLMIPVVLLTYALAKGNRPWQQIGIICVTLVISVALTIALWTVRNYYVFGKFVPISTNGGEVFVWANSDGDWASLVHLYEEAVAQNLDEVERDHFFYRKGIEWLTAHPIEALRRAWERTRDLWKPLWPWPFPHVMSGVFAPRWEPTLIVRAHRLLALNRFLLILATIGLIVSAARWQQFLPLMAFLVLYTLFHTLGFCYGDPRFRQPLNPLLGVFAAQALVKPLQIVQRWLYHKFKKVNQMEVV